MEDGKIIMEQIPTSDQLADIMTKSLAHVKFQELRDRIGIVNIRLRRRMLVLILMLVCVSGQ